VPVTRAPTPGPALTAAAEGAALLWLESPSNPGLDACDIAALAEAAHRGGGLVGVDKSLATPLGQRPLDLGADLSVASDTKARTGHSDLILGHVAARDPALVARLREWRLHGGAIPGPQEVWLDHRSLATSTCGWSDRAPTPSPSPAPRATCSAPARRATRACPTTPRTPWRRARCAVSAES
jgi:cystathionine gamma-lyase